MDGSQFDALTRILSSRRSALAGLLGSMVALGIGTEDARAHNPVLACKQIKNTKRRLTCLRRARAHKRKHRCKPKPAATFCANRCGITQNNCKKLINCTCRAGQTCLDNFGCNRACATIGVPGDCPVGCACGIFLAENPAIRFCVGPTAVDCDAFPLSCVTSANCPRGSFCGVVSFQCGTNRCVPNCPH